jgi:hypothetical protein
MRSPEEMLELVGRATPEPWFILTTIDSIVSFNENNTEKPFNKICILDIDDYKRDDFNFIVASREWVPEAAKRLIEAKSLLNRLFYLVNPDSGCLCCKEEIDCEFCNAKELLNDIKHFLDSQ